MQFLRVHDAQHVVDPLIQRRLTMPQWHCMHTFEVHFHTKGRCHMKHAGGPFLWSAPGAASLYALDRQYMERSMLGGKPACCGLHGRCSRMNSVSNPMLKVMPCSRSALARTRFRADLGHAAHGVPGNAQKLILTAVALEVECHMERRSAAA